MQRKLPEQIKKILIIRFSSIGDIILTTPLIRQLRNKFPQATIDYLLRQEYLSILKHNPHLSRIISLDTSRGFSELQRLKQQIKSENYDLIIDLHRSLRSRWLTTTFRLPPLLIYRKNSFRRFLLVKFKINRYPNPPLSVAEKYLRAASPLGLDTQDLQPELHLSSEIKSRMGEIYSDLGKQHFKVIIAPGARHFTKRWLPEYFQKLIILIHEQMGWKTILVGDKSEKDWIARIQEGVPHGIVQDFSGELTLEETCGLISSAPYFISNDSGLMHAAAAFRKPQVAIFGGTVRELGFFPINPQAVVVENSGLNCRPCSHIGRPNCPKHHFKCMKEITPQQVFQQFQRLVLKK